MEEKINVEAEMAQPPFLQLLGHQNDRHASVDACDS
jgi:hypothetical protein